VIIRVFRARVRPGAEEAFEQFVLGTGLPMVKAADGCIHVSAGKSRGHGRPEFVVFAWLQAVIEPEEEHMLAQVFCDH